MHPAETLQQDAMTTPNHSILAGQKELLVLLLRTMLDWPAPLKRPLPGSASFLVALA